MNNSAIFLKEIWEWIVIYHECMYIYTSVMFYFCHFHLRIYFPSCSTFDVSEILLQVALNTINQTHTI
jgi:hypothetical protein